MLVVWKQRDEKNIMVEETLTIRFNEEEREALDAVMKFLNLSNQYGGTSKAIKACLFFTKNVTHDLFGAKLGTLFYARKASSAVSEFQRDDKEGAWNG
jgi:hypothetical protein